MRWAVGGVMPLGLIVALGAGSARADLRTVYAQGASVLPGGGGIVPEQVAVNNNIGSPYYGYVYVGDNGTGHQVAILRPAPSQDGTGAGAYQDTGLRIQLPGTTFAPFGVSVGSDDTVWASDANQGILYSAPPVPPTPATVVNATQQLTGVGFTRSIQIVGPITNVKIFDGPDKHVKLYTGSAPDAQTVGTYSLAWDVDLTNSATKTDGINNGPYGIAVDPAGNAYVAAQIAAAKSGTPAFIKITPDGTQVPTATFPAPLPANAPVTSNFGAANFVPDASYPGGGYLYLSFVPGGASSANGSGYRYDLNGNYLDGYGPTSAAPPPNYTVLALSTRNSYAAADDLGNLYVRGGTASATSINKVLKHAPFVVDTAGTTSAGGAVKSSPTAVDGVVYFGSDDGKLYAYTTADGNPVAGFPVDVSAAVGAAVKIQSRAAVYITDAGKGIYFTTDRGDVCRVNADGTGLAHSSGVLGAAVSGTPAVLPDGTVYVGLSSAEESSVVKLTSGLTLATSSPNLGGAGSSVSSVAVDGNSVYVGLTGGTNGDIVVLNAADLTPRAAGVASGEGVTAPPYVNGLDAYVGTLAGNFYKVNSITFAPDVTFGALNTPPTPGHAAIGEPLPGSAFNDGPVAAAVFYVGSSNGKVWQVNGTDGSFNTLYDTGSAGAVIPGVVVNRDSSTLAFGVDIPGAAEADPHTGAFYEVPTNVTSGPVNAQVFQGYGAFNTTPTLDRATGRFLIGSDDMNVYAFSSR
jgi:hypothetical protein